ncbi:MAG: sigma-70 family RNA polymerase sigma factor [Chitinispirillaceae bacterium]|jgi:RNA polymerase sigma-70 factor (ECF subfamily)
MDTEKPEPEVLIASPDRFREIVTQYGGYVYTIAFRMLGNRDDAEEAAQDTFIKAYNNLRRFDRAKGWKNWLCTIALNTARDYYRKTRSRRQKTAAAVDVESVGDDREVAREVESRLDVQKILSLLDIKYRAVIVLFYMEQREIKEIAVLLNKSENLIKVQLFRARKQIIEKFGVSLL